MLKTNVSEMKHQVIPLCKRFLFMNIGVCDGVE